MQVAGYVRVSSRSQARAQAIEQQIDRLRSHAAAQSWNLLIRPGRSQDDRIAKSVLRAANFIWAYPRSPKPAQ